MPTPMSMPTSIPVLILMHISIAVPIPLSIPTPIPILVSRPIATSLSTST